MAPARTAGPPSQWPPHIQARYGITDRSRWVPVAVAGLALSFLGVVLFLGLRLGNAAIDAGVLAYTTVADDRMTIGYEVDRRELSPATCVLRARASDGFDVGYAVVELLGCGLAEPPPGIPGAQFRPGTVAPEQPWTPPIG